ncbi:MAG: LysM peptidoglycan-binding domain-containing protein [Bacteroidetes bacterium]|nr:LysM peptidoglycan-binding domain-containing protein [Bacteroidota bacterium]
MKKISIVLFLIIFCCRGSFASFIQPADSAGVKSVNGKQLIEHRIEAHEGWYSIARKYGISYAALRLANKDSSDKLSVGQIILVPTDKEKNNSPGKEKNYIQDKKKENKEAVYHVVKPKETVFAIAKKYHVKANDLKKWNDLSAGGLKIGEKLIVGYKKTTVHEGNDDAIVKLTKELPLNDEIKQAHSENAKHDSSVVIIHKKNSVENNTTVDTQSVIKKSGFAPGRKEVSEQGVATWIDDENINPHKYFALHRTANIGSIIKVTNRMNKRSIFVKVVGKLPDTGDNDNVIIKISKASAEKLGVRDQRFQCALSYGVTEK